MCPNDKSFGKFFPSESDNLQEYCMREREERETDRETERERGERDRKCKYLATHVIGIDFCPRTIIYKIIIFFIQNKQKRNMNVF